MDPHFDGIIFQTHSGELKRRLEKRVPPLCVLDVRAYGDYARGHVPHARSVQVGQLATGFPEGTDASTEFFVVGADWADRRVRQASLALRQLGARRIVELPGGIAEWQSLGFSLEGSAKVA